MFIRLHFLFLISKDRLKDLIIIGLLIYKSSLLIVTLLLLFLL